MSRASGLVSMGDTIGEAAGRAIGEFIDGGSACGVAQAASASEAAAETNTPLDTRPLAIGPIDIGSVSARRMETLRMVERTFWLRL